MAARLSAPAPFNCLYTQHRIPCRLSTGRAAHHSSCFRQVRSQVAAAAVEDAFESLAGLICPQDIPVALGVTDLGRGLVATRDVPAGECLLSLDCFSTLLVVDEPLRTGDAFGASVLSEWQSLWMELPPLLANYLRSRRGDWFRRLVAWLLWLKQNNTSPVWDMYLQLLPNEAEMSSLMNYTPEERAELQLPHLIALAEKEREGIEGLHASLFSSTTGQLKALDLAPNVSDTLWAASMVNSRCFSDAAGRELLSLMVPLADMANHSIEPNAGYRLDPGAGTFSVTSTKAIPAGSEVLISYLGEKPAKSSAELMKDYGFVLPGNTNDTLSFTAAGQEQQQLLRPLELLEASAAAVTAAEGSHEAATQKRRTQAVIKSLQPYVAQTGGLQGGSSQSQQALLRQLRQQCQEQLDSCATSIQEDEQLQGSAAAQGSVRLQAAIAVRLEHKRLLATAISVLDSYEKQLTAKE